MLTNQDFAGRVLSSLEDLRERLAVLETEVRHVSEAVSRVEAGLQAHLSSRHGPPGNGRGRQDQGAEGNGGASVTIRVSRRMLGGGGLLGGGLVAAVVGLGRLLGWW
jgi:hypothetical protein